MDIQSNVGQGLKIAVGLAHLGNSDDRIRLPQDAYPTLFYVEAPLQGIGPIGRASIGEFAEMPSAPVCRSLTTRDFSLLLPKMIAEVIALVFSESALG